MKHWNDLCPLCSRDKVEDGAFSSETEMWYAEECEGEVIVLGGFLYTELMHIDDINVYINIVLQLLLWRNSSILEEEVCICLF